MSRHTVVLDLDETLVHSLNDLSELIDLKILSNPEYLDLRSRIFTFRLDNAVTKPGTGEVHEMWGIIRPHVKEFLHFCFSHFHRVVVWSAGKPKYVNAVVRILFRDVGWPHRIMTSEDCSKYLIDDEEIMYKPLRKVLGYQAPQYVNGSQGETGIDERGLTNIFLIDDRKTTFSLCNPRNGILIPRFEPELEIESLRRPDNTLLQLMNWLRRPEVMLSPDVRTLNKNAIFAPERPIPSRSKTTSYLIPTGYPIKTLG